MPLEALKACAGLVMGKEGLGHIRGLGVSGLL